MFDLDERLRCYQANRFTDEDIVRCTGLKVRAWRELLKIGAVRSITERRGPGRVRSCDSTTFKRTAIIAALNAAGFSLAMAARIAYFLPFDDLVVRCLGSDQRPLYARHPAQPRYGTAAAVARAAG